MNIELIKLKKMPTEDWYWYVIKIDGQILSDSWTGRIEDAQYLYDAIVADPNYLTTREIVVQSQDI